MNFETREFPPDGSPMVLVPAGPFVMGLAENDILAEEHEKPQRQVYLSAFWIDLYPVTNARFALFLAAGGYNEPGWWTTEGWAWKCRHDIRQPVAGVSWYEADAYARWAGRRLPTDAEWEKAARGTDGRRYPWGDEWPSPRVANFGLDVGRTTPVGLYPDGMSPYGCHDMAGNVNNWTSDWYWPTFAQFCAEHGLLTNPHLHDRLRDHLDIMGIRDKVDRGGGFATPREYQEVLSCARKVHWPPDTREPWNGFRTALS